MSHFKTLYTKAKTYKELSLAIVTLSDNAVYSMINSMDVVNSTTGLDMKQECLLKELRMVIEHREREAHLTAGEQAEQEAGC